MVRDFRRLVELDGVLARDPPLALEGDDVEGDGKLVVHDLVAQAVLCDLDRDGVVGLDVDSETGALKCTCEPSASRF